MRYLLYVVMTISLLSISVGGGYYFAINKISASASSINNMWSEASAPDVDENAGPADRIIVNLASRIMTVYIDGHKAYVYPVGVGTVSTPSPTGTYHIISREENPIWVDPHNDDNKIPSGPHNPLGYRWLGFSGAYGIHGTNVPSSIGGYVSNGCIRMREADVEALYSVAYVGMIVEIVYDRFVTERADDGLVICYVYPDGYGWTPDVSEAALKELAEYGLADFIDNKELAHHIAAHDGKPWKVMKSYDVWIGERHTNVHAVEQNENIYIPAAALAEAFGTTLKWDSGSHEVYTEYGRTAAVLKKGTAYVKPNDLGQLFRAQGTVDDMDGMKIYRLSQL